MAVRDVRRCPGCGEEAFGLKSEEKLYGSNPPELTVSQTGELITAEWGLTEPDFPSQTTLRYDWDRCDENLLEGYQAALDAALQNRREPGRKAPRAAHQPHLRGGSSPPRLFSQSLRSCQTLSDTPWYNQPVSALSPRIEALEWDEWNLAHITKHRVTRDEVEDVVAGEAIFRASYKNRIAVTGSTDTGRLLTVIIGESPHYHYRWYVFSARSASRGERRAYLAAKGGGIP